MQQTKQELALKIHQAVNALNEMCAEAVKQGLSVDFYNDASRAQADGKALRVEVAEVIPY